MSNVVNLNDLTLFGGPSTIFSDGIETYTTVDVSEVERLKAQGWIVESTYLVMVDILAYNLVRLS